MIWMTLKKRSALNSLLLTMRPQTIIFGESRNGRPNVLNTVILLGKRLIFEWKGKELLTFPNFLSFLKHYFKLKGIITNRQGTIKDYDRKRNTSKPCLED